MERLQLTNTVAINQFVEFGSHPYKEILQLYSKKLGEISCNATRIIFTPPMALEDKIT